MLPENYRRFSTEYRKRIPIVDGKRKEIDEEEEEGKCSLE